MNEQVKFYYPFDISSHCQCKQSAGGGAGMLLIGYEYTVELEIIDFLVYLLEMSFRWG